MRMMAQDTQDAIGRLEAALASPQIPPKERQSCARLVEKLRRPVRVGLFGRRHNGNDWLLTAILGQALLPPDTDWPTMEIVWGPDPEVTATLADATTLTSRALPDSALMAQAPVFLRIAAPVGILRRMSFLYLAAEDGPGEQLSALAWAAPRTEIAIWCTATFTDAEARIWEAVPDKLKNHALLAATGNETDARDLMTRDNLDFEGVFPVPRDRGDTRSRELLGGLLDRLEADIDEAHRADVDVAQLILHRLGHLAGPDTIGRASMVPETTAHPRTRPVTTPIPTPVLVPEPVPEPAAPMAARNPADRQFERPISRPRVRDARRVPSRPVAELEAERAQTLAVLSEPFLYLKRRSRALAEMLDWQDPETEDWAAAVLEHCNETAEALRERAQDWPEDHDPIEPLRRTLEDACDVAVLMQIEGGPAQAEDAATLLMQLRGEFERELAA